MKKLAIIILPLLLFSCADQKIISKKIEISPLLVNIESRKEYLETTYFSQQNECRVSVTTYFPESVNKDTARLRHHNCPNETNIAKLLESILASLASHHDGNLSFTSISMGRLEEYPSFSEKLKVFTSLSPRWNIKKGEPFEGRLNNFITEALNQVLPSFWINKILQPYWKELKIPGVEKVLIDPLSKLPFDCQFWILSK